MKLIFICIKFLLLSIMSTSSVFASKIDLGPRPYYLINQMPDSPLKEWLRSCKEQENRKTDFSIGHRGAALMFPEHTKESYLAAVRMGAGIIECDVTFTKDLELVCRHAQNNLHSTTNIVNTMLEPKCSKRFRRASIFSDAKAECRTSDLTLAELQTLTAKMDGVNDKGKTRKEYMQGTEKWQTDLYSNGTHKVMTHAESIELFRRLGVKFTPELKAPVVDMPFNGFTQADYAQKLINEYKKADISPSDVYVQSFNLDDILYWIENEPEFGKQAVFLDDRTMMENFDAQRPELLKPSMQELKNLGVNYLAPPMWALLTIENGDIVPSQYAIAAKEAELKIITWTLERSGALTDGGGWYYQSIKDVITSDGDIYEILHILAKEVGIESIFSDWPATVTYYANCMGIE